MSFQQVKRSTGRRERWALWKAAGRSLPIVMMQRLAPHVWGVGGGRGTYCTSTSIQTYVHLLLLFFLFVKAGVSQNKDCTVPVWVCFSFYISLWREKPMLWLFRLTEDILHGAANSWIMHRSYSDLRRTAQKQSHEWYRIIFKPCQFQNIPIVLLVLLKIPNRIDAARNQAFIYICTLGLVVTGNVVRCCLEKQKMNRFLSEKSNESLNIRSVSLRFGFGF